MNVVTFPRRRRFCSGCGVEFTAARPHHSVCAKCFLWRRIAWNIAATRRLLEATR